MEYLKQQFPNRWIGRGGQQNWSMRSPDLTPLDYHENMMYERKVNRRQEVHPRIFYAVRRINLEFQISVAP
jgi:hypothetical protein